MANDRRETPASSRGNRQVGSSSRNYSERPSGNTKPAPKRASASSGAKGKSSAAREKARKKKKRNRIILFSVEAVVLIGLLIGLWVVGKTDKLGSIGGGSGTGGTSIKVKEENIEVNPEIEEKTENYEHLNGYRNIALFGVDSRTGQLGKGTLSDSIIIASIKEDTKDVKLVSIYRDSYLNIGNDIYNKANNAYSKGGPEQAINMLNTNLDLNIKEYATVDFKALVSAVDLLGGVTINVTSDEISHLNNYTVETSKVTGKTTNKLTKTGEQLLDGVQAVSYCRIRYTAGDDFKRSERQRSVIEKMVEKAKKTDFATLDKIINEVFPKCATSLSLSQILDLAKDVSSYKIVSTEGFPFEKRNATLGSKGDCVIPINLEENVGKLHEYLFGSDDKYQPSENVRKISNKIISDTGIK